VIADKAYTHPNTRAASRQRKIKATIPERSDQIARRKAKGSAGGRPPAFDHGLHKLRNVVERCFNRLCEFRGVSSVAWPPDSRNEPLTTEPRSSWPASSFTSGEDPQDTP
jgi:transposase